MEKEYVRRDKYFEEKLKNLVRKKKEKEERERKENSYIFNSYTPSLECPINCFVHDKEKT